MRINQPRPTLSPNRQCNVLTSATSDSRTTETRGFGLQRSDCWTLEPKSLLAKMLTGWNRAFKRWQLLLAAGPDIKRLEKRMSRGFFKTTARKAERNADRRSRGWNVATFSSARLPARHMGDSGQSFTQHPHYGLCLSVLHC